MNPPDASVRVLNVAPSYTSLGYRREQVTALNQPVALAYEAGSNELSYDEDTYDFHATIIDPATNLPKDVDDFSHKLVTGTLYTFVFFESGGAVTHTILETPRLVSGASKAQVQATHTIEGLPRVDLYLETQGTGITGATPWGTIGFKESLASQEVTGGVYELTVTEAGNPANVLFVTQPFTLEAASASTLVLCPDTGEGIAPFGVVLLNGLGASPLVDPRLQASVRALNGAVDQAPRDVAFASQFTPPLFSGAAFATPTSYQPLAAGTEIALNVTPVGNPSVLEASTAVTPLAAKMYTTFFTGEAGALNAVFQQDDRRRIAGQAKITFYDAAPVSAVVEALILKPGTDPTTIPTTLNVLTPGTVQPIVAAPNDYEIWLRDFTAGTMLAGPVAVTLADKGLYGIFLSNDANGTTIDMALIDGFP